MWSKVSQSLLTGNKELWDIILQFHAFMSLKVAEMDSTCGL